MHCMSTVYTIAVVVDPEGGQGDRVKVSHKKDGRRRQLHRCYVFRPLPHLATGSATALCKLMLILIHVNSK